MKPEAFRSWQRVVRDLVLSLVGTFMLIFETVAVRSPNAYVLAAGLTALGLPSAIRFDEWRQNGSPP